MSAPRPAAPGGRHRVRHAVLLTAVVLLVGAAVAATSFLHDSRTVAIGAHTTSVSPTLDGRATFDLGPLLPRVRVPVSGDGVGPGSALGLGIAVDVGDTESTSLDALVARDALIASQPDGELLRLRQVVRSMAVDAAVRGLGAGLLAAALVGLVGAAVGARRRAVLADALRHPSTWRSAPRGTVRAAGVGALAVVVGGVLVVVARTPGEPADGVDDWVPLTSLVDGLDPAAVPGLADVQVAQGAAASGGVALVESAVSTYEASVRFYDAMLARVPEAADDLREPRDGETVAVLVSDRHDNIGMDPVVAAVARAAGATVLLDAGDDTSSGGSWERFSLSSLEDASDGLEAVAVPGNHDSGDTVPDAMADAGFTVLDGEPVDVAGIRFLGAPDPRSSGYTAAVTSTGLTAEGLGEQLAATACEDGDVSTLLVHSPATADVVAATGCVDLVLSGHLHRQVGPDVVEGEQGRTTAYTNGTTGGAAFAFALGSKLRREAEATLVTYEDGRPVGLQPVRFSPGGQVLVDPWVPLG